MIGHNSLMVYQNRPSGTATEPAYLSEANLHHQAEAFRTWFSGERENFKDGSEAFRYWLSTKDLGEAAGRAIWGKVTAS